MATKDGRSQIWYADGNGNVEGNTETVDYIAETIISTYNEHYGTDIQLWTPETKTLQVGGTVPNWNAYEKISNIPILIAVSIGEPNDPYAFGQVVGNIVTFETMEIDKPWVAISDGRIVGYAKDFPSIFTDVWKAKIDNALGINSTYAQEISSLQQGDVIQNWSSYQKIV